MRNAFAAEVTKLAAEDERLILLSGDIGNRLFDKYQASCRGRFFNCGVAEANMVSVAAGMAMCGLRPVAYTIAPFITSRCLEQIRVDLCYHNLPVVLVGVGAGLSYAELGATHESCEDIAFMRMLPGMTVICPGDPQEVRGAIRAALAHDGPVYIRLGKRGEPNVHVAPPAFTIGKAIVIRGGDDICLLSTGNVLPVVADAAAILGNANVSAMVVSFHTVKPLDQDLLARVFERFSLVVTVEEHSVLGGLGGSVAEWLASRAPQEARLLRMGTADRFLHEAGDQQYARERFSLTAQEIARTAHGAYVKKATRSALP